MRFHNYYYQIKPYLPWALRMAIRRRWAQRKRRRPESVWPINPVAATPPPGWPGWPDGKRFCVVLTHDVESPTGLARCHDLVRLEAELDLRSAFYLIPEGSYRVPDALRNEIADLGFEVGVHDLRHDGKLVLSRQAFMESARRINRYLADWGAVGFRSGFTLRNLEWFKNLEIRYDASTFDTDPFEPQPDGVGTIFPFWVPGPDGTNGARREEAKGPNDGGTDGLPKNGCGQGRGYVELPYTLPQDSTLFLVLGETNPDIWMRKLDWIAQHGGMALVNVHPDYLQFKQEPESKRKFPIDYYARFLEYARSQFGSSFWNPLPRELASYVERIRPALRPAPKRIGMVTYSHYEVDARVRRYAEGLVERGDHVDVFALKRDARSSPDETRGVNLIPVQQRRNKQEQGPLSFLLPLVRFFCTVSVRLAREHWRASYQLIHVHNVPDFLVFTALLPKLTGAKVILDIHDMVPEFYSSKFGVKEQSLPIVGLKLVERLSARFANWVIVSNDLWREKYASRTGVDRSCSTFVNNVDLRVFQPRPRTRNDGKRIVLFPGGLQSHQGLDIAIRAFYKASAELPDAEFHVYGDGNAKSSLVALTRALGLEAKVRFFDPLPIGEIAGVMADADLGVVPKRADTFGNEAYSTKIMEFMAVGVPVVVSSTRIDRYYFDDSVVRFFNSGDVNALADAILLMLRNPTVRSEMAGRAFQYVARNSWETRKHDYLDLVDSLTARPAIPACNPVVAQSGSSGPRSRFASENALPTK